MKEKIIKVVVDTAIILAILALIWQASFLINFKTEPQFGVTFSARQARDLDLPWKTVYTNILDDLSVKLIRLPVYWDEIEQNKGNYNFSDIDWQIQEAQKRNVKIILAIGQRVPRWPECHRPGWVANEPKETQDQELLNYIEIVVKRYKDSSALEMWQVENEPFLNVFGDCPAGDKNLLIREIAQVKRIDPVHPILITDSGELSSWLRTAKFGDYFGTSVYRSVGSFFGKLTYNHIIPPLFYRAKAWLTQKPMDKIFVSELQAEPWGRKTLLDTPIKDQAKSFDYKQFEKNIAFSKDLGFPRVYMWGVEWWYWKKTHGDASFWELAKKEFN